MVVHDFFVQGLSSYQLLYGVGCALTIAVYLWLGTRAGVSEKALTAQVLCVAAMCYVGARLLHLVQHSIPGGASAAADPADGTGSFGALLFGAIAFETVRRIAKMDARSAYDRAAIAVPIMVIVGRLGCFFAGCCFGTTTGLPWAIRYPAVGPRWQYPAFVSQRSQGLVSASDPLSLPVHPVQLYLAAWALASLLVVLGLQRSGALRGKRFFVFLFLHCVGRFAFEFVRGDETPIWGPFHTEHLYSLVGMSIFGVLMWRRTAAP